MENGSEYQKTGSRFFYTTSAEEKIGAKQSNYLKDDLTLLQPNNTPNQDVNIFILTAKKDPEVVPLYRLSRNSQNSYYPGKVHFFTANETEKSQFLTQGWSLDGVSGYIYLTQKNGTVPLFRLNLYNQIYQLTTDPYRLRWAYTNYFIPGVNLSADGSPDWDFGRGEENKTRFTIGYVYPTNQDGTAEFSAFYHPLPGQTQPREPLLGYKSDSLQGVMDQYINWASSNGIDFFAYDWYWAPKEGCSNDLYLHEALENAFLKSKIKDKMKFAVAWFPMGSPYTYDMEKTKKGIDYFLQKYAIQPNYLKIDGKPVFFWEVTVMFSGLSSTGGTSGSSRVYTEEEKLAFIKETISYANKKAQEQSLPGVYFVEIGGMDYFNTPKRKEAGFEAFSSYNYVGFPQRFNNWNEISCPKYEINCLGQGSILSYEEYINNHKEIWLDWAAKLKQESPGLNFIPTIGAGWDRSVIPWIGYRSQVLVNNKPEIFKKHLQDVKTFLENNSNSNPKMVLINSWNEWTEGSIIEPDTKWGTKYIEQIKEVFADRFKAKVTKDYDGNGKAYPALFRPTEGNWYIKSENGGQPSIIKLGQTGDIQVAADYDGDGKTDPAIFRPTDGSWHQIIQDKESVRAWGQNGDIPVPADYDGDGRADVAIWRPSTKGWGILTSSNTQHISISWGEANDIPVPADYDGDGRADIAVFRPSNGTWHIKLISDSNDPKDWMAVQWGQNGDIPVPADYKGLHKAQVAVWRPSNGFWLVKDGDYTQWGESGDIPVPADYDNDGKVDISVWRQSNGFWLIKGGENIQWGRAGDEPSG